MVKPPWFHDSHRRFTAARRLRRGFTLVELMVVVVIAGILALIGMRAMDKHLDASRSIEASTMVQSIRAAQERHRAMTGLYLDVSQEGGLYPRNPSGGTAQNKVPFFQAAGGGASPDNSRWLTLGPTVAGPVQYGYLTRAGLPGQAMPAFQVDVGVDPPTPTESWYLIEARGDVDGDGRQSYFAATSLSGEVFSQDSEE